MSLFQKADTILSSGGQSDFKIECDFLTDDDIECLAYMIKQRMRFREVVGVKGRGGTNLGNGIRLQNALQKYCGNGENLPTLICDDVLTTGKSMEATKEEYKKNTGNHNVIGCVLFSRYEYEKRRDWIYPLFILNSESLK